MLPWRASTEARRATRPSGRTRGVSFCMARRRDRRPNCGWTRVRRTAGDDYSHRARGRAYLHSRQSRFRGHAATSWSGVPPYPLPACGCSSNRPLQSCLGSLRFSLGDEDRPAPNDGRGASVTARVRYAPPEEPRFCSCCCQKVLPSAALAGAAMPARTDSAMSADTIVFMIILLWFLREPAWLTAKR
jgi:hypothetical protein